MELLIKNIENKEEPREDNSDKKSFKYAVKNKMEISIKKIIEFFDDKSDHHKGDVNAVVSVLGEDLNIAIYEHFRKNKIDILENSVTQGFRGGKYLDRWVVDKKENILWQCEIKNWSATAIGGKELKINARPDSVREVVNYYWNREFEDGGSFSKKPKEKHPNGVSKALLEMKKPRGYEKSKVSPLLIYWMPISLNSINLSPLSVVSVKKLDLPIATKFKKLYIFSVSLYLRQLYKKGQLSIILDMPAFERRLGILKTLSKK
jgi:hypothetical protein